MLSDKIKSLLQEVATLEAHDAQELECLRIKYLSKKGIVNELMGEFRSVAPEQKREIGMLLNELKTALQERINTLRATLATAEDDLSDLDLTRTPYPIRLGTRHPLTIVKNEIIDIFSRLGFAMADGPEVEDDWHVFGSMNFADDHPARDMQATFFGATPRHRAAYAHQFGAEPRDGEDTTAHPRDMPWPRLPQRSHLGPRPLLLPPGGRTLRGQGCEFYGPQAGAPHLCP